MSKNIAIQNGLGEISRRLKKRGHNIVDVNNSDEAIDVIIYSNEIVPQVPKKFNVDGEAYNDNYVLMLNADEYSLDEIVNKVESL